jgi:hypothetical protein
MKMIVYINGKKYKVNLAGTTYKVNVAANK